MMKRLTMPLLALALLVSLTGCSDAVAKLNDRNTTLFTVGKTSVTKGDLYDKMVSTNGAAAAVSSASRYIAKQEIEVTDEMRETAEESLTTYKTYYGDTFTTYLEQMGMSEEEYVEEELIPSLLAAELPKKYVDENFDTIVSEYSPIKGIILDFASQEAADAALADLKAGKDVTEVAKEHESSSSGSSAIYTINSTTVDSVLRTILNSATPDDGWFSAVSGDGATYAVMKVEDNDVNNFKDEAIEELVNSSTIQDESTTYWFTKYGFHIYDKTIYDAIKANYSSYLIQDKVQQPTSEEPVEEVTEENQETTEETEED